MKPFKVKCIDASKLTNIDSLILNHIYEAVDVDIYYDMYKIKEDK